MTKPSEIPSWPDKAWYEEYFSAGMEHYERARADAWEARCRVLDKAARRFMGSDLAKRHMEYGSIDAIAEALSTIGDLPPLPPQQQRTGDV